MVIVWIFIFFLGVKYLKIQMTELSLLKFSTVCHFRCIHFLKLLFILIMNHKFDILHMSTMLFILKNFIEVCVISISKTKVFGIEVVYVFENMFKLLN